MKFEWEQPDGTVVEISDPDVWVSQVQGPLSMKLLENLSNGFSENDGDFLRISLNSLI